MNIIVRVTSTDPGRGLARLLELPLGLDVWEVKPDYAVLRAAEASLDRLKGLGFQVEQLDTTDAFLRSFVTADATEGYHSAQSLEDDLRGLASSRPEIAELHEIGWTVENRPIWALRLGERRGSSRKLLFMGCHHAREWIAVEVPYLLAEHIVKNADSNPVARWLSRGELWVVPMVNPDGHEFSRTTNRLWRKNRRPNPDGTIGVDPNRNYGYMWGTLNIATSSHVPGDETYVGPRAFSEPETRAVRDLVGREIFQGVVTYHSYSQLILWPWGYTQQPIPDATDRRGMERLGQRMHREIKAVHGKVYT
ncbi:MAG: M14 family metallopeptidase, partial [Actinomycetota bacterium]